MKHYGIFVIVLLMLSGLIGPAFGQEKQLPDFTPAEKGSTIKSPDWSQFQPQQETNTETPDAFFKRCMTNPTLPPQDQEALCACMASNVAEATSAKNPVQAWAGSVIQKQETPYEYFLARTYASCAWVEMGVRANDDCYRQTRYRVLFRNDRNFDRYCTCFSKEAESYVRKNATTILNSYIGSPAAKRDKESKPPSRIIMDNADYNIYMEAVRNICIRQYSSNL